MLFACSKYFQQNFLSEILLRLLTQSNKIFCPKFSLSILTIGGRNKSAATRSIVNSCVSRCMPIGQFLYEAVVTIKVTSTISASFFIDLLGVAAIGHYRNFANKICLK